MLCLVMKGFHSQNSAGRAADYPEAEKRFFAYPPPAFYRFFLVQTVCDKCGKRREGDINNIKNYRSEIHINHFRIGIKRRVIIFNKDGSKTPPPVIRSFSDDCKSVARDKKLLVGRNYPHFDL